MVLFSTYILPEIYPIKYTYSYRIINLKYIPYLLINVCGPNILDYKFTYKSKIWYFLLILRDFYVCSGSWYRF